jgi:hypothetical protein
MCPSGGLKRFFYFHRLVDNGFQVKKQAIDHREVARDQNKLKNTNKVTRGVSVTKTKLGNDEIGHKRDLHGQNFNMKTRKITR